MRVALVVAFTAVLAAGCLGPMGGEAPDCGSSATGRVLHPHVWPFTYNAGVPSDLVYFSNTSAPTAIEVRVTDSNDTLGYGHGAALPFEHIPFTPPNGTVHFGAVRVLDAVADPGGVLSWRHHDLALAAGCDDVSGGLTINWGARPTQGEAAAPGQGAHVWYAGFWENGTLFDTNLQALDVGSGWPKAGWYEGGHWDPIPVYVYDQDRSDQPPHWKSLASNAAGAPPQAQPTAGNAAAIVDGQAGTGYFTTIKGFNEAVKGLPVGTRQAFRLAPEDAYTQPGREAHLLYGDALVFLVEVRDVVDEPCPSPALAPGACTGIAAALPAWFA